MTGYHHFETTDATKTGVDKLQGKPKEPVEHDDQR